ncbi:MAG: hypothetical protein MI862_26725 [Desulfobacterales bacterium]|nr:hypothetical protein [Desulfobacterales bacterium]
MLEIENKLATATQRINALRSLEGDPAMLAALDEAENALGHMTDKGAGLVKAQTTTARLTTATSCLGLQLPIPDMPDALGEFAGAIKDISDGAVFDRFLAYLENPDLAALTTLKDMAGEYLGRLEILEGIFAEFSVVQGGINNVLSTVSALIGCTDPATGMGLGKRFNDIGGVLEEVSPQFKAGLDAVTAAEEHFSSPVEIMNDAKGRVTGMLDLDSKVTRIKDQFQQARGWLS